MKKITLWMMALMMATTMTGLAQNLVLNGDLESWDDPNTPSSWAKAENISQEAVTVHGGTYSAAHMSESTTKDFQQDVQGITPGNQYTISYWYLDNDVNAKSRIWSYWMDASGNYLDNDVDPLRPTTYSTDDPNWIHWEATLVAPATATQFRFEVRVYNQDGATGGYVFYDDFSVSGDQTTDPEPSNYPTDFAATGSGLSINLSWTDAVGTQLPRAYLILAAQEGYTAGQPIDGMPVDDDLDWSDGIAALNIDYGMEAASFLNLQGNTTYTFKIFPYTNTGGNIDYKTDGTVPSASAMTSDITVINIENFTNDLGTWTPYNVLGDLEWVQSTYGGTTFAKASGYSGQAYANEDWLISPAMNLTLFENVLFSFITAANYTGPALELYYSQDYEEWDNPNDYTWVNITDQALWSGGSFAWQESGEIALDAYGSSNFHLAYKFTSTDAESMTWEVTDILITGELKTGVEEVSAAQLQVYPNPVCDALNVVADEDATLSITSLTGQVVLEQQVHTGTNRIPMNVAGSGLYLIKVTYANGTEANAKVIVR